MSDLKIMITGKIKDRFGKHYTRSEIASLLRNYNNTKSDQDPKLVLTQSKTQSNYILLDILVVGDTSIHGITDREAAVDRLNANRTRRVQQVYSTNIPQIAKINSIEFLDMFLNKKKSITLIDFTKPLPEGITVDICV